MDGEPALRRFSLYNELLLQLVDTVDEEEHLASRG